MSNILEFNNLTVKKGDKNILDSVSISFETGKSYTLTGPSGCGKSLFLKLAAGLATPKSGTVLVFGKSPSTATKKLTAYLSDSEFLADFRTIGSLISLYSDFFSDFNKTRATELLSNAKLSLKDKIKELSFASLKKLAVILTLSRDAKLFLLDNPLKGIDPAAKKFILEVICEKKGASTLIITSDNPNDLEGITDESLKLFDEKIVFTEAIK